VLQDGAAGATRLEVGGSIEKRNHHLIEDVTRLQCQQHDQRPKDRTRTRTRTYKNTQVEDIDWQNVHPYLTEDVKRQVSQRCLWPRDILSFLLAQFFPTLHASGERKRGGDRT
jgi:hypothetical protein